MNIFIRKKNQLISKTWRPFRRWVHTTLARREYRQSRREFTRNLRLHEYRLRPQNQKLKVIMRKAEERYGDVVFLFVSGRSFYFTAGDHEMGIDFDSHCCVHHQTTGMTMPIPQPIRLEDNEMKRVNRLFRKRRRAP
jgi:hypothetical protein